MDLSVIIPALNETNTLPHTLRTLRSALYSPAEIIVVDGGSNDDTVSVAALFADLVIQSKPGRAIQMNEGAKAASGKILLFLHADTHPPHHFDLHIKQALSSPGHAWGHFKIKLSSRRAIFRLISLLINGRTRATKIATGDLGLFIEKSIFDRISGYPDLRLMEDIAISKNLKRVGAPAALNQFVISSSRRWEDEGICRTILKMWGLRAAYFLGATDHWLERIYNRNSK